MTFGLYVSALQRASDVGGAWENSSGTLSLKSCGRHFNTPMLGQSLSQFAEFVSGGSFGKSTVGQ